MKNSLFRKKYQEWLIKRNLKNQNNRAAKKTRKQLGNKKRFSDADKQSDYLDISSFQKFTAPDRFSLVDNPEETIGYFNDILDYMKNSKNIKKTIYLDLSNITYLTIDSLMYILAIMRKRKDYRITGNLPKDNNLKDLVKESGFMEYVYSEEPGIINKSSKKLQIKSGFLNDPCIVGELIDFLQRGNDLNMTVFNGFYQIIIELLSNTYHHAYNNKKNKIEHYWYLFAEKSNDIIKISFIDTGKGIPNTIRKNFKDWFRLTTESQFILSALLGEEFRTRTNKLYRGAGLPLIYEYCKNKEIDIFKIISGKGSFLIKNDDETTNDLENDMRGTVYYWELNVNTLREKIQ